MGSRFSILRTVRFVPLCRLRRRAGDVDESDRRQVVTSGGRGNEGGQRKAASAEHDQVDLTKKRKVLASYAAAAELNQGLEKIVSSRAARVVVRTRIRNSHQLVTHVSLVLFGLVRFTHLRSERRAFSSRSSKELITRSRFSEEIILWCKPGRDKREKD